MKHVRIPPTLARNALWLWTKENRLPLEGIKPDKVTRNQFENLAYLRAFDPDKYAAEAAMNPSLAAAFEAVTRDADGIDELRRSAGMALS